MKNNLQLDLSEEQFKFRELQKELANLAVAKFSLEKSAERNLRYASQQAETLSEMFVAMAPYAKAYAPVDVSTTRPMARILLDLHHAKYNIYLNYRGDIRIEYVTREFEVDGYWYEGKVVNTAKTEFEPLAYICNILAGDISILKDLYHSGYFEELSQ